MAWTEWAIGNDAARGSSAGSHQAKNAATRSSFRTSVHPFQQVIADAQCVGHEHKAGEARLDGFVAAERPAELVCFV